MTERNGTEARLWELVEAALAATGQFAAAASWAARDRLHAGWCADREAAFIEAQSALRAALADVAALVAAVREEVAAREAERAASKNYYYAPGDRAVVARRALAEAAARQDAARAAVRAALAKVDGD